MIYWDAPFCHLDRAANKPIAKAFAFFPLILRVQKRSASLRGQYGSFPRAMGTFHSAWPWGSSSGQPGEGMPTRSQKDYQGRNRNLLGCRQPLWGWEVSTILGRKTGQATSKGTLLQFLMRLPCVACPECQLSHKSTHWVTPSNLSIPAGKQHIRPLTALLWLVGWEVVF